MNSEKYMVCDDNEGYFDMYIFSEPVNITRLEKDIINYIKVHLGEWNLEDLEKLIRANYNVKDVVLVEKGYNAIDVSYLVDRAIKEGEEI